jgi:hypothetical protein
MELARRGGPSRVRIAYTRRMMPEIEDLTLEEIAQKMNVPVLEAVTTHLLACGGSVSLYFPSMSQKDVERIMKEMYIAGGQRRTPPFAWIVNLCPKFPIGAIRHLSHVSSDRA